MKINNLESKQLSDIPEDVLKRMPSYLNYLRFLKLKGKSYVSADHIAKDMDYTHSMVVNDISYSRIFDPSLDIYNIEILINGIETMLGYHKIQEIIVVGAKRFGDEFILNKTLKNCNLKIEAVFDSSSSYIGKNIKGYQVMSVQKLKNLAYRMNIQIGILMNNNEEAQQTADLMSTSGIKIIWNFTTQELRVPSALFVLNSDTQDNLVDQYHIIYNQLINK